MRSGTGRPYGQAVVALSIALAAFAVFAAVPLLEAHGLRIIGRTPARWFISACAMLAWGSAAATAVALVVDDPPGSNGVQQVLGGCCFYAVGIALRVVLLSFADKLHPRQPIDEPDLVTREPPRLIEPTIV